MADAKTDRLTVEIGGPTSDKVLAEIRGVQRQFGLPATEAVAMILGFGIAAMSDQGLIAGRFSEPMSRAELLRQMHEMIVESDR